ncbi:alpha/beta fold hydrolase [Natranaerofaba carboxydovora]|uniref:alpha/beta fold hydrolase n=1 Tax=Natranaerofaba carboxydovora TaxID=2742683 RepID=UPI001F12F8D6|nr:alpha/beta fold hydrolase [Natranaerofaba carboxydovora]UMZ74133.1 Poly(3-hydroxyalkanoate) polymerase subunit PhaC [Natranaerofaba carboxydovora]
MFYWNPWLDLYAKQVKFFVRLMKQPEPYWSTPNEVSLEKDTLRLRYFPNKHKKLGKPILVLPPQAGHHSNITDYSSNQSLVNTFHKYGFDVYVAQWLSPNYKHKNFDISDYIRLTNDAVHNISSRTGHDSIHLVGQCQGGWQAAMYASLFPQKISSLVVAAAPINLEAERGPLNDFIDNLPMSFYESLVASGFGLLKGDHMLAGFKNMDPHKHYYKKYIDLWNLIWLEDENGLERFDRFTNWYELTQDLPGKFYLEVVEKIFKNNGMVNPGTIELNDKIEAKDKCVDLTKIDCPVILMAGEKDNITPPNQCLDMKNHISTPKKDIIEITTKGGHIGTLMGKSALKNHWTTVSKTLANIA